MAQIYHLEHGRSQTFLKGGGGGGSHWRIQRVLTRLSPNVVGRLLTKRLKGGGDHRHPRTPPWLCPCRGMQQKFIYRAERTKKQVANFWSIPKRIWRKRWENSVLHWHSNIFNAYAVVHSYCSTCCQRKYQCIMPITGIFAGFTMSAVKCSLQDLAYRFKVSVPTASRVFNRGIDVMRARLDFLIQWPEREELRKTMPLVFRQNFGLGVAVIIDCFEIFTDRPPSLIARAQVVISFLSKACGVCVCVCVWGWGGGGVSDKHAANWKLWAPKQVITRWYCSCR